jgi:hypothetical protein
VDKGDAKSFLSLVDGEMKVFSGQCLAIHLVVRRARRQNPIDCTDRGFAAGDDQSKFRKAARAVGDEHRHMSLGPEDKLAFTVTAIPSYQAAADVAGKWAVAV